MASQPVSRRSSISGGTTDSNALAVLREAARVLQIPLPGKGAAAAGTAADPAADASGGELARAIIDAVRARVQARRSSKDDGAAAGGPASGPGAGAGGSRATPVTSPAAGQSAASRVEDGSDGAILSGARAILAAAGPGQPAAEQFAQPVTQATAVVSQVDGTAQPQAVAQGHDMQSPGASPLSRGPSPAAFGTPTDSASSTSTDAAAAGSRGQGTHDQHPQANSRADSGSAGTTPGTGRAVQLFRAIAAAGQSQSQGLGQEGLTTAGHAGQAEHGEHSDLLSSLGLPVEQLQQLVRDDASAVDLGLHGGQARGMTNSSANGSWVVVLVAAPPPPPPPPSGPTGTRPAAPEATGSATSSSSSSVAGTNAGQRHAGVPIAGSPTASPAPAHPVPGPKAGRSPSRHGVGPSSGAAGGGAGAFILRDYTASDHRSPSRSHSQGAHGHNGHGSPDKVDRTPLALRLARAADALAGQAEDSGDHGLALGARAIAQGTRAALELQQSQAAMAGHATAQGQSQAHAGNNSVTGPQTGVTSIGARALTFVAALLVEEHQSQGHGAGSRAASQYPSPVRHGHVLGQGHSGPALVARAAAALARTHAKEQPAIARAAIAIHAAATRAANKPKQGLTSPRAVSSGHVRPTVALPHGGGQVAGRGQAQGQLHGGLFGTSPYQVPGISSSTGPGGPSGPPSVVLSHHQYLPVEAALAVAAAPSPAAWGSVAAAGAEGQASFNGVYGQGAAAVAQTRPVVFHIRQGQGSLQSQSQARAASFTQLSGAGADHTAVMDPASAALARPPSAASLAVSAPSVASAAFSSAGVSGLSVPSDAFHSAQGSTEAMGAVFPTTGSSMAHGGGHYGIADDLHDDEDEGADAGDDDDGEDAKPQPGSGHSSVPGSPVVPYQPSPEAAPMPIYQALSQPTQAMQAGDTAARPSLATGPTRVRLALPRLSPAAAGPHSRLGLGLDQQQGVSGSPGSTTGSGSAPGNGNNKSGGTTDGPFTLEVSEDVFTALVAQAAQRVVLEATGGRGLGGGIGAEGMSLGPGMAGGAHPGPGLRKSVSFASPVGVVSASPANQGYGTPGQYGGSPNGYGGSPGYGSPGFPGHGVQHGYHASPDYTAPVAGQGGSHYVGSNGYGGAPLSSQDFSSNGYGSTQDFADPEEPLYQAMAVLLRGRANKSQGQGQRQGQVQASTATASQGQGKSQGRGRGRGAASALQSPVLSTKGRAILQDGDEEDEAALQARRLAMLMARQGGSSGSLTGGSAQVSPSNDVRSRTTSPSKRSPSSSGRLPAAPLESRHIVGPGSFGMAGIGSRLPITAAGGSSASNGTASSRPSSRPSSPLKGQGQAAGHGQPTVLVQGPFKRQASTERMVPLQQRQGAEAPRRAGQTQPPSVPPVPVRTVPPSISVASASVSALPGHDARSLVKARMIKARAYQKHEYELLRKPVVEKKGGGSLAGTGSIATGGGASGTAASSAGYSAVPSRRGSIGGSTAQPARPGIPALGASTAGGGFGTSLHHPVGSPPGVGLGASTAGLGLGLSSPGGLDDSAVLAGMASRLEKLMAGHGHGQGSNAANANSSGNHQQWNIQVAPQAGPGAGGSRAGSRAGSRRGSGVQGAGQGKAGSGMPVSTAHAPAPVPMRPPMAFLSPEPHAGPEVGSGHTDEDEDDHEERTTRGPGATPFYRPMPSMSSMGSSTAEHGHVHPSRSSLAVDLQAVVSRAADLPARLESTLGATQASVETAMAAISAVLGPPPSIGR